MNPTWLSDRKIAENFLVIVFMVILGTPVAFLIWAFSPHWKTIYSGAEGIVEYREMGPTLQIHVMGSPGIYPTFLFDYWQDGLKHKSDLLEPSKTTVEPAMAC